MLQFANKDRPSDPPMNTNNTNGGDQHGEDDFTNAQRQKRQRNDLEDQTDEEVILNINALNSDGSAFDLNSSDSVATVKNANAGKGDKGPREYQPPNRPTYIQDDDKERLMIVKLERLRDKEDRYSSHIAFLKECHQARTIPKGLRIDIEPSIGNNDSTFCEKWYKKLEDCSLSLMQDIIDYSVKIEDDTSKLIKTQSDELKATLGQTEHTKLIDTMNSIAVKR